MMTSTRPSNQRGNVMFLILIGVVLFAALSYAVTSSNRFGGDGVSEEKMELHAAQVIQTCGMLRETMRRFIYSGKTSDEIILNNGDIEVACHQGATCLFGPEGGGAAVPLPPRRKGGKGGAPQIQMKYMFMSKSDGGTLAGYNNDEPLPMFYVTNITIPFCMLLNKKVGRDEEAESVGTPHPEFRDACVADTGALYFECPLATK